MKVTPPTISYFHDIQIITASIIEGMLCINKPRIVCQNPKFSSKTSAENIVKNRASIIDRTLGIQTMNLFQSWV